MSSGSVAYSRWVQAQCRHSLNLQRGQHACAGLGIGPHDPSGGQHDAVRCWLGLGSNDPLRCGLNSSPSNITAMRNLPQFAEIPQGMHGGALLLPCSASHVLPWTLGATSLLVAVPRLGGLGHQNFCPGFSCRQGGCAHSLRCSRRPAMLAGRRMSSGSRITFRGFRPSVDTP